MVTRPEGQVPRFAVANGINWDNPWHLPDTSRASEPRVRFRRHPRPAGQVPPPVPQPLPRSGEPAPRSARPPAAPSPPPGSSCLCPGGKLGHLDADVVGVEARHFNASATRLRRGFQSLGQIHEKGSPTLHFRECLMPISPGTPRSSSPRLSSRELASARGDGQSVAKIAIGCIHHSALWQVASSAPASPYVLCPTGCFVRKTPSLFRCPYLTFPARASSLHSFLQRNSCRTGRWVTGGFVKKALPVLRFREPQAVPRRPSGSRLPSLRSVIAKSSTHGYNAPVTFPHSEGI
jgi:hypothetical protein